MRLKLLPLFVFLIGLPIISEGISNNNPMPLSNAILMSDHKDLKKALQKRATNLDSAVINKAIKVLRCAKQYPIEHNNILTIIDYSLPSNKKRLWIFDLATNQLLFHTYVSHGIKSGTLLTDYFSNKVNSKASSIGVYTIENSYKGRHGLSLKLKGLDKGFNDNAYRRFIVIHGSWYVNEDFIEKYGRAGRSWGCPTLPINITKSIINTIKDNSLLIVYYPGNKWFQKSKYLNCDELIVENKNNAQTLIINPPKTEIKPRKKILFADLNNNNRRETNEPIIVTTANQYKKIFNSEVPLKRMLRRQINKTEYIALTNSEFERIFKTSKHLIYFVIPVVRKIKGFYATEMKIVNMGNMTKLEPKDSISIKNNKIDVYTIHFKNKSAITLKSTKRFIRWLVHIIA